MKGSAPQRDLWILTAAWLAGLLVSGFAPYDRVVWLLEVFPALIAWPLLWWYWKRFPFSTLATMLILVHGLILMGGGAYTYAREPLGYWMQEWLHTERNPYDKLGHFAQGFVPAIVAREILLRHFKLTNRRLVVFLAISICGAVSAAYEILEWWVALIGGQDADAFLGTQGDVWDTQSDMLFAFIGAGAAMLVLPRWHDRSMARVKE